MLTEEDFITLPFPQDLTRAGLEYAFRSLAFGRVSGSPDDLRRLVGTRSAELALRRHLDEQTIPYSLALISDPLAPQILLDGKRCILQVTIIDDRFEIRKALHEPETLLECEAHLPEQEALPEEDLIVHALALALIAHREEETLQALEAGQPAALIRPFPEAWASHHGSSGLGKLVLKTDSTQPVDLILSGTDENLDYLEERVTLTVMERVVIPAHFQTLAYLQTGQPAQGKIAVHSTVLNETITAYPLDWHNIWLYGMKILFAGALNVREMRRLMTLNLRKSAANQKIKIAELKPLSEFFP